MAQNVTIAGAAYSGVPAVDIPKTGGGTARFYDAQGNKALTPGLTKQTDIDVRNLAAVSVEAITKELLAGLDGDFTAENIKAGVEVFGLAGTYKGGQPRNLLDNSWFVYPFCQVDVGDTHGGTQAYAVDRWKLVSGTAQYVDGTGLKLTGTISQVLETTPGTTSAFVGMASGTATISRNGNTVTIQSSGGVIKWAALYDGTYTADNMPEYQYKGYAAEELECKRYFGVIYDWMFVPAVMTWDHKINLMIPWPVWMRVNPTCSDVTGQIIVNGTYIDFSATPSSCRAGSDSVEVRFDDILDTDATSRAAMFMTNDDRILFSADL